MCAIAEYQRRNTFGFTTWLCYSGYWMGTGFCGVLEATGTFESATKGLMMSVRTAAKGGSVLGGPL